MKYYDAAENIRPEMVSQWRRERLFFKVVDLILVRSLPCAQRKNRDFAHRGGWRIPSRNSTVRGLGCLMPLSRQYDAFPMLLCPYVVVPTNKVILPPKPLQGLIHQARKIYPPIASVHSLAIDLPNLLCA